MKSSLLTAAFGLAAFVLPGNLSAAESAANADACSGALSRASVATCALLNNPALAEALADLRVLEGRREGAQPVLPKNPVLSGSLGSRSGAGAQALNWSATVAQEIEVAGQRSLRIDVADSEGQAQTHRLTAARTSAVEKAWRAYFSTLAARERMTLAARLETSARAVATTVRAMTVGGLASELEAELAEAASVHASYDALRAEEQWTVARAQFAAALSRPGLADAQGPLEPLTFSDASTRSMPPELRAQKDEVSALVLRADLLRRERAPNPTVSLFAQNDGFNEQVFGVGLSFPLPLPQPVGQTSAGPIAEHVALAQRADAVATRLELELSTEAAIARAQYDSSLKALALDSSDPLKRASERLESLAVHVKAGRWPVRDALAAQTALMERLSAHVDAKEALCLSSVRLARAQGHLLEGVVP